MIKAIPVLAAIMLSVNTALASDLMWLEREWISDGDLSAKANPSTKSFTVEELRKFKSIFGRTVWRFQDGIFTGVQTDTGFQGSSPYSIRPAEGERWEVIFYEEGLEIILTLWEVEGGFCANPNPTWVKEYQSWSGPGIVECYVPTDP